MTASVIDFRFVLWLACTAVSAWALTAVFRRYALQRRLVDVPNGRSSHRAPTPRGGGGAIVVATTVALAGVAPWWLLAGGLLVALVGFVDDHRSVRASIRLAAHFGVGVVAVMGLGGAPELKLAEGIVVPQLLGDMGVVFFVASMINLTNFMDGIDGIAGSQALSVCVIGAAIGFLAVPQIALWQPALAVGAATAGFLVWNWPPARVFMGDVGSNFIGYMLSVLTIQSMQIRPELGVAWVILSAVFVVDATVTLLRRIAQRAILYEAHRTHAYQHLAMTLQAHRPVTLSVLAVNLIYLGPLAWCVANDVIDGALGLALAYVPLVLVAVRLRAGLAAPALLGDDAKLQGIHSGRVQQSSRG
jgi:Fuc2NAc and GlcNAc transferase